MRHFHSHSPFRFAIAALPQQDGYVEALLGLASQRVSDRRPSAGRSGRIDLADRAKSGARFH